MSRQPNENKSWVQKQRVRRSLTRMSHIVNGLTLSPIFATQNDTSNFAYPYFQQHSSEHEQLY